MEKLVEIGKTVKAHGLDGGLKFAVNDEYLEDFLSAEVVFIQERGQPVPYFIEEIRGEHLVVMLEGVSTKEVASTIAKKKVLLREGDLIPEEERTLIVDNGLKYEPYIGYSMLDEKVGELGEILEIVEYPQQELARIAYKGKDILIPLNTSFIEAIDNDKRTITVLLPEGMIAIQL